MKVFFLIQLIFLGNLVCYTQNNELVTKEKELILMGSAFKITSIAESESKAIKSIELAIAEIKRIENLISSWKPDSETTLINKNAGAQAVTVSKELYDLIYRSKKISKLTNGAFDISFAGIDKIWDFSKKGIKSLPDHNLIKESIAKIDYNNIILDPVNQTVFLKETKMKIGFGAIGKGYAANRAKQIMKAYGIHSGVVNAGGDLVAWGKKIDDTDWKIAIPNPKNKSEIISWLNMSNLSVVTSGNYERFIEIDGKKYCHIINPKTGWPVSGLSSVTIISSDAEIADALATSVFILGKSEGLKLINLLDNIECLLVTDNLEIFSSKGIDLNYVSNTQTKKL